VIGPLSRALGPAGRQSPFIPAEMILEWNHSKRLAGRYPFAAIGMTYLRAVKKISAPAAREFQSECAERRAFDLPYQLRNVAERGIRTNRNFDDVCCVERGKSMWRRLKRAIGVSCTDGRYVTATNDVLHKHRGLWFNDESYVISSIGTETAFDCSREKDEK